MYFEFDNVECRLDLGGVYATAHCEHAREIEWVMRVTKERAMWIVTNLPFKLFHKPQLGTSKALEDLDVNNYHILKNLHAFTQ